LQRAAIDFDLMKAKMRETWMAGDFGQIARYAEKGAEEFVERLILVRDGAELMMQTITSVQKDEPKFAPQGKGNTVGLFIEVEDFEDVKKRLEGYPIAMPERKTFYGMVEIGVIEPGGNTVVFAARI